MTSSRRLRNDANSLGHSVTHVKFDREINLFIISLQRSSHPNSCLIRTLLRWVFIGQYLQCVSMWDSRLRVVIGEHHFEFYYKKVRKCFTDNYKVKKEKKLK